jgi:hypothetical protein
MRHKRMSKIGQRYRKGELRYWDALVEIAIERGISRKQIPAKWSDGADLHLYLLIGQRCQRGRRWPNARLPADFARLQKFLKDGHDAVQRELNPPQKRGKGQRGLGLERASEISDAGENKRKERDNLWRDGLTDVEFTERLLRRENRKLLAWKKRQTDNS